MTPHTSAPAQRGARIEWIDYAKGVCIILVVMMHSTLGVEAALGGRGFLHHVVEFVAPFRMPAFFMMSGLLLSRTIDQPWRVYLDRKAVHFAYFYLLWLAISCVLKFSAEGLPTVIDQFALGLIEPFGTLWFIYILPLFFVATKLGCPYPALLALLGVALHLAAPRTGWTIADEFAARYVYFLAGYLGVNYAMKLASWAVRRRALALALLGFATIAAIGGHTLNGHDYWPSPATGLALGFSGSAAIIVASSLMAERAVMPAIRFCGANSLTIYLAFFAPMAFARTVLVRFTPGVDPTAASVAVTICALVVPLALERLTRGTPLTPLFHRPASLRLAPGPRSYPA
ncbi:MAG: acyltransferase family protein [Beijerinckiaceae bacterium]